MILLDLTKRELEMGRFKSLFTVWAVMVFVIGLSYMIPQPFSTLDKPRCGINDITIATVVFPFKPVGCVIYRTGKFVIEKMSIVLVEIEG